MNPARLWAVVGATGTGKTDLSLRLAAALAQRGLPAEIVNADAMQLYRGMDIGTAKLPVAERRGIPHHLFDALEVTDEAAVAWYQDAARTAIGEIHARGADAILVGGSGLYVSSVVYDFRFPPHDDPVRAELEADLAWDEGAGSLDARLQRLDPVTAARIDPRNGRRVVRAPRSSRRERTPTVRRFPTSLRSGIRRRRSSVSRWSAPHSSNASTGGWRRCGGPAFSTRRRGCASADWSAA